MILGLLAQTEAEQLIQQPLQQSLTSKIKDAQLLVKQVYDYAGDHPAFIQIVMKEGSHFLGGS